MRGGGQMGGPHPVGFHRGARGAPRGLGGPHGGGGGFRGRGGSGRGFQPGRLQPTKKETLKFEGDYDFEQANEQFQEVLSKLQKSKIEVRPRSLGPALSCLNDAEFLPDYDPP